ncbi:MAG: hypothetical protein JW993_10755 [Sedimentisphaerales bacterium]|nr:hypothetical protein [Sedimentisphaerales bacterium]
MAPILKRFAKTIEIEVSPEAFVFRCKGEPIRIATHGYLRRLKSGVPPYEFGEEPGTSVCTPISLFSSLPREFHEDIVEVLAAFILYGITRLFKEKPNRSIVRPILLFRGIERFETGFGFEYAVFRAAGSMLALGATEVYFESEQAEENTGVPPL